MITNKQSLAQKQSLQQRLSPQQIQYVNLLQLPMAELTQRIKEEMEINPVLEFEDPTRDLENNTTGESNDVDEPQGTDNSEVNWEQLYPREAFEPPKIGRNQRGDNPIDIPRLYVESPLEKLERQIDLVGLSDKQRLIADQIVGSLDVDGYFRRDLSSVADSIAFNNGIPVKESEVFDVLSQIQKMDPPGIAARDLQECLLLQLESLPSSTRGRDDAIRILKSKWDLFEKKHFDKIAHQLHLSESMLADAYHCIQSLDPKPWKATDPIETNLAINPDVNVFPIEDALNTGDADALVGDLVVVLSKANLPKMTISAYYQRMLDGVKTSGLSEKDQRQVETFLRQNMDSAKWFLDALKLRGDTLLLITTEIVRRQYTFFMSGNGMRPLIMKDIAEAVGIDISTVSRMVNAKFVQTRHGTYELRSFFNEGIGTAAGEEVTNREVQSILYDIIQKEDKIQPLSDQALTDELNSRGFDVARRTVAKYREALGLPVARLRKQIGQSG
jgi:RNA polymerase sigma-54 factor